MLLREHGDKKRKRVEANRANSTSTKEWFINYRVVWVRQNLVDASASHYVDA